MLFGSGSDAVKPEAKKVLDKIASEIKTQYGGASIRVEGYTDTDPINRTKELYKDNLDLSAARARTVAQFLQQQGISPRQLGLQATIRPRGRPRKEREMRNEL